MSAAEKRIADIVGAGVAVVTVCRKTTEASPGTTSITNGAGIAIVANRGYVHVLAAKRYIAHVVSAGVVVVTIGEDPAYAGTSTVTGVVGGTGIAVLAGSDVWRVEAAASRIAGVVRAYVEIVAVGGETADTKACAITGVRSGTGIEVIAGQDIGRVDTSCNRVARIVGTDVRVVAVGRRSAEAHAGAVAGVTGGTSVAVLAGSDIRSMNTAGGV